MFETKPQELGRVVAGAEAGNPEDIIQWGMRNYVSRFAQYPY